MLNVILDNQALKELGALDKIHFRIYSQSISTY